MGLFERYRKAYPTLLEDVDTKQAARLEALLSTSRAGQLWPEGEVAALLARLEGRISFEEYLELGRGTL